MARSLLISTINLGLPRDFNGLRVAKMSRFATSALTAGKQPLYCMRRADLCVSGETASISFYIITVCSSYLRCRWPIKHRLREDIFLVRRRISICRMPVLRSGAHRSGTTAVVSLTESLVSRQVDDSSIQVTSFSTALSLLSLDRLPASRLLPPRSGLERSDFVHCAQSGGPGMSALAPLSGAKKT